VRTQIRFFFYISLFLIHSLQPLFRYIKRYPLLFQSLSSPPCCKGESARNQLHSFPAASPTRALLWALEHSHPHSHMLTRLTYVICETIKEPRGPRGTERPPLRPRAGRCWIRGELSSCPCLWVAA